MGNLLSIYCYKGNLVKVPNIRIFNISTLEEVANFNNSTIFIVII